MNATIRRKISAWILLVVFLPMLVLSSLHIHESTENTEISCADCVHHICHGHLTAAATWAHDCVLCQFLTLTMLTASAVGVVFILNRGVQLYAQNRCRLASVACGVVSLRVDNN